MKIIIEDRQFIEDLERLQYEFEGRKNIVTHMLEMNIITESFQSYHDDYLKSFKAYNKKKYEVETRFVKPVKPNANGWSLDFESGELTID